MALPTINKDAVQELASGLVYVAECTQAGSITGTPTRYGYVSGTSFDDNSSNTTQFDEGGNPVAQTDGNREMMFKVTPMQRDKDTIEFAPKTSVGKYYTLAYRLTKKTISGSHSWLVAGITQVARTMSLTTPGAEGPETTFTVLNNDAALTLNLTTVDAGLSSVAIAANECWVITNVAT